MITSASSWVWDVLWWSSPPQHSEVSMWVNGLCIGQWYRWREQYVSWQQTLIYEQFNLHVAGTRVGVTTSTFTSYFFKFLYEGQKLSKKKLVLKRHNLFQIAFYLIVYDMRFILQIYIFFKYAKCSNLFGKTTTWIICVNFFFFFKCNVHCYQLE